MTEEKICSILEELLGRYEGRANRYGVSLPLHPITVTKHSDVQWTLRSGQNSSHYVTAMVNPQTGRILGSELHLGPIVRATTRDSPLVKLMDKIILTIRSLEKLTGLRVFPQEEKDP